MSVPTSTRSTRPPSNLMGHQGGWPLNMFPHAQGPALLRRRLSARYAKKLGQPAFTRVLTDMADLYRDKREEVDAEQRQTVFEQMANPAGPRHARTGGSHPARHRRAAHRPALRHFPGRPLASGQWRDEIPPGHLPGHCCGAPICASGIQQFLQLVTTTMDNMLLGGLYDHVGGGFFRYTMDERWLVPHFEKMLCDNALLVDFMTSIWQFNRNALCRQRVEETVDWMLRDMKHGRWLSPPALKRSPKARKANSISGAKRKSTPPCPAPSRPLQDRSMASPATAITWASNILRRMGHPQPQLSEADEALLAKQRGMLLAARDKRVQPARDDNLLADWNGLAIRALAQAGAAFDRADWVAGRDHRVRLRGQGCWARATGSSFLGQWRRARRAGLCRRLRPYGARGAAICGKSPARRASSTPPSAGSTPSTIISGTRSSGGYCTTADDAEPLIVRVARALRSGRAVRQRHHDLGADAPGADHRRRRLWPARAPGSC